MSRVRTEAHETFVDRGEQLETLNGALGRVIQHRTGEVIFVDGAPGIGKTALANRFLESIDSDSVTVLQATGREFGTGPYSALGQMLQTLLASTRSRDLGKQAISTLANIAKLVPNIGPYVDVGVNTVKGFSSLSSADLRQISDSLYVKNVFLSLFEKLSSRKVVVAIFDDVQRFDTSSLEALGYLIDYVSKIRVLVIVCFRERFAALEREKENVAVIEEIINRTETKVIHLEPLQTEFSTELVRQMTGGRIQGRNIAEVVERTGGNPLYIVKTLKEIGESGIPPRTIPTEMRAFVNRQLLRIAKESEDSRLILDYAGILGRRFSILDIAEVSGFQSLRIRHALERIASDYGIVLERSPEVYEFDHDTTREIILQGQGSLAKGLHLKVAEFYDRTGRTSSAPQLTAYHYEMAGSFQMAFQLYRTAAVDCTKSLSFESAASYLRSCLKLVEGGRVSLSVESEASLLLELANAEFSTGVFNDAFQHALSAIEMCGEGTELMAESRLLAGRCCRYIGTIEASERGKEHLKIAAELFEKVCNYQKLGTTYSVLSTFSDHFGDHRQATKFYGESHKAFHLARDNTGLATLQRKSGMIFDSRRAIPFITNALEVFRKTNSTIELARSYNNLGAEHFYLGEFESAETSLSQALDIYRRIDSYEIDAPLNNLSIVYLQTKRMSNALNVLTEAESKATEDFDRICIVSNIGLVQKLSGNPANCLETLSRMVPVVERSGEPVIQDYFAHNLSTVLFELGRKEEALEWVDRYPINEWKGDRELAKAKRLKLRGKILVSLGKESEGKRCITASDQILLTKRPQKWFYELEYYPCDIHFLD